MKSKSLTTTEERVTQSKRHTPVHPGEILLEEFLEPLGLSQNRLARKLGVPPQRISAIVRGQRDITMDTAIRLAKFFQTTPYFWLNLQSHYDLEMAEENKLLEQIEGEVKGTAPIADNGGVQGGSLTIPTYKEIQRETKKRFGFLPKTCWIAHTKEVMGLPVRNAPNRRGSERGVPCPPEKMGKIKEIISGFLTRKVESYD